MEHTELQSAIESLIFVSEEPISVKQLVAIFEQTGIEKQDVKTSLNSLIEETNNNLARGLELVEIAGGYQFRTKTDNAPWIQKLSTPKPIRLSQPALETLAIIAYRQPLTRSEVEEIRGVDAGGVVKTLLERKLICILGRKDEPGQPLIYGTTQAFLELFTLNSLKDLPPLADIEELARKRVETQTQNEFQLAAEQLENQIEQQKIKEQECETKHIIDGEEETEPLDDLNDTESTNPSDEGDEILDKVEESIKELRKLEKDIFPKAKTDEKENEQAQPSQPKDQVAETDSPEN